MNLVVSNGEGMNSFELRLLVNAARSANGESEVRNDQFLARVEDELGDDLKGVQLFYIPHHGNQVACYPLSLDQCMLVGMRESKAVRRGVLAKLKELEAAKAHKPEPVVPSLPDFSNPAIAARAWAEQYEKAEQANQQLAIAAPKVEFVDQYVDATGLLGFRQVCKLLSAKEKEFREFLKREGIMYELGKNWTAYQKHIDAGRFEVRTGKGRHNDHAYTSARFTPKGVEWVSAMWRKECGK